MDIDPGYIENRKGEEREAQDTQGLNDKCRENMSPLSRLIRGFRKTFHRSPLGKNKMRVA